MEDQDLNLGSNIDGTVDGTEEDLLPDDPVTLKELVEKYRQEAEEAKRKISEANGNAKNLRLKKKSIEQELKELRKFKQKQEELAKQLELSKLDESEKLKRLLDEERESKQQILAKVSEAERAAAEAKIETQLMQLGVTDNGLKLVKPLLNAKISEDPEADIVELVAEIKQDFPILFKQDSTHQTKKVKTPATTGVMQPKLKEPKTTSERHRVSERSKNHDDRMAFKRDVLPKYGITI